MQSPFWSSTAIIIAYDDSDGFYDHVMSPIVMQSSTSDDQLNGPGSCGSGTSATYQGRCGYGPRLPLLVISPYAKANYVDDTVTDQSSILRFIEDNWNLGRIGDSCWPDQRYVQFWVRRHRRQSRYPRPGHRDGCKRRNNQRRRRIYRWFGADHSG